MFRSSDVTWGDFVLLWITTNQTGATLCTFSSCSSKRTFEALDLAPRYRICGGAFGLRGLCFRSGWLDFAILRNLSGVACHRNHFGRHGERTRKVGREGRCRGMKRHTSLNTLMTCETSATRTCELPHCGSLWYSRTDATWTEPKK